MLTPFLSDDTVVCVVSRCSTFPYPVHDLNYILLGVSRFSVSDL